MKHFAAADLARRMADVTRSADKAPIVITNHGKARFVMLSIEAFEALDPRQAFHIDDLPDDIAEDLLRALPKKATRQNQKAA